MVTFSQDICVNEVVPVLESRTPDVCKIQEASLRTVLLGGRGAMGKVINSSVKVGSVGECELLVSTSQDLAQTFVFSVKP